MNLVKTSMDRVGRTTLAGAVFAVLAIAAIPVALVAGSDQWFFLDEWSMLADRELGSIDDLLRSHNGHWSTMLVVVYRSLFGVVGVTTYLPYQVLIVGTHVATVVMIRVLMRRAGVSGWVATAVAAALLLLGSGGANIVFGFQISLVSSMLLGSTQLLLSLHSGSIGRRDVAAVVIALVGLTTSGVMVAMIVGVGVATFAYRGVRPALLQIVPPAFVYVAWYLMFADDGSATAGSIGETLRFFAEMNAGVFAGIGQFAPGALVLALVAVLGAWSAGRSWSEGCRRQSALVLGVTFAWLAFAVLTSVSRAGLVAVFENAASPPRYVHVGAVLLAPLIALGIDALAGRHVALIIVPIVALAIGVPGNIDELFDRGPLTLGREDVAEAMAYSDLLDDVPGRHRVSRAQLLAPGVELREFDDMSVQWLRDARDAGRIDRPEGIDNRVRLDADLRLVLDQIGGTEIRCDLTDGGRTVTLEDGDRIRFDGRITVVLTDGVAKSSPVVFDATGGRGLRALAGPVEVVVAGAGSPPKLCMG